MSPGTKIICLFGKQYLLPVLNIFILLGAANNIGCMLAWEFALRGANLILVDLDADGCAILADNIRDIGQAVKIYQCDLTKRDEINR